MQSTGHPDFEIPICLNILVENYITRAIKSVNTHHDKIVKGNLKLQCCKILHLFYGYALLSVILTSCVCLYIRVFEWVYTDFSQLV